MEQGLREASKDVLVFAIIGIVIFLLTLAFRGLG